MPFTFTDIDEPEDRRMIELLDEADPKVSEIRTAEAFVTLINRCTASIEEEVGREVHRGRLTFVAMQWRDSIGRM